MEIDEAGAPVQLRTLLDDFVEHLPSMGSILIGEYAAGSIDAEVFYVKRER
jgi:hypothetical protein